MGEIRIRNRETGEIFIGEGKVPAGYDLLGPASSAPAEASAAGGKHPWAQTTDMARQGKLPTGEPIPTAGEMATSAAKTAGTMALPVAGAIAGSPLGVGGVALGGMAGEGINQALGITDVDPSQIALQGAVPGAMGAAGGAVNAASRFVAKRLPGAAAVLQEEAAKQVLGKVPLMPNADAAYAHVNSLNPRVTMTNLREMSKNLLGKERMAEAGLKLEGVQNTAAALSRRVEPRSGPIPNPPAGEMTFQDIRVNLRRIGDKIRETREAGGEGHGAWKALFKATMDDLDAAVAAGNPAQPAVEALKRANEMAKREFAADEIAYLMSQKGHGITVRADLGFMTNGEPQVQVNFNRIVGAIQKSEDIRKALTPTEYKALITDLTMMAKEIPALPTMAGVNAGSMRRITSIGVGGGLGTAFGLVGGPGGAALGGAIGTVIGAKAPDIIAKAVMSPTGRQLLYDLITANAGVISPRALAMLGAAVTPTEAGRDAGVTLSAPFKP